MIRLSHEAEYFRNLGHQLPPHFGCIRHSALKRHINFCHRNGGGRRADGSELLPRLFGTHDELAAFEILRRSNGLPGRDDDGSAVPDVQCAESLLLEVCKQPVSSAPLRKHQHRLRVGKREREVEYPKLGKERAKCGERNYCDVTVAALESFDRLRSGRGADAFHGCNTLELALEIGDSLSENGVWRNSDPDHGLAWLCRRRCGNAGEKSERESRDPEVHY